MEYPGRADFSSVDFINNCLPEIKFSDIKIECNCLGRSFRSPLYINAITGGTVLAGKVNALLATVARESGIPMAVGSQMVALEQPGAARSFRIIRKINPRGIVWANIGSYADPEMACRVINMIDANAIQIHLNVSQELMMVGGDRDFTGTLERISAIKRDVKIPVIVKEVGFGIAREQASALMETGIDAIDISGSGGTDFIKIERRRTKRFSFRELYGWGIPTAISIVEVHNTINGNIGLLASGGLHNSLDIAKAISLGASMVGMAALPLYYVMHRNAEALIRKLKHIEDGLKMVMTMVGVKDIEELQNVPLVITGKWSEWLGKRGYDLSLYANRSGKKRI